MNTFYYTTLASRILGGLHEMDFQFARDPDGSLFGCCWAPLSPFISSLCFLLFRPLLFSLFCGYHLHFKRPPFSFPLESLELIWLSTPWNKDVNLIFRQKEKKKKKHKNMSRKEEEEEWRAGLHPPVPPTKKRCERKNIKFEISDASTSSVRAP
jgi:hypothetical protein